MSYTSTSFPHLPLNPNYPLSLWNPFWEKGDTVRGYLLDEQTEPKAIVREYYKDRFVDGLRELKFLEAAGVRVAKHLPFIAPDGKEYLIVEYIEGKVLSEDDSPQYTDMFLELAKKVDHYSADAIQAGRGVLVDISSPFQYILRAGEPVLVDLDMHQHKDANEPAQQEWAAYNVYNELTDGEGLVPRELLSDAPQVLEMLYHMSRTLVEARQK